MTGLKRRKDLANQRDAIRTGAYMIGIVREREVKEAIAYAAEISILFNINDGTVRNNIKRDAGLLYIIIKRRPLTVKLTQQMIKLGDALVEIYGKILLMRLEQQYNKIRNHYINVVDPSIKEDELFQLAKDVHNYWSKILLI